MLNDIQHALEASTSYKLDGYLEAWVNDYPANVTALKVDIANIDTYCRNR